MSNVAVPQYRWEKVLLPGPFAPRDGAGALTYKDKMWLIGGWNPNDKVHFPLICNNEVWSSPDGANWTLVKPGTFGTPAFDPTRDWEGRHCAGYVVFKNKMWIVGGDGSQEHYQPDVWSSEDGKTWTRASQEPTPWGKRVLHYTVVYRDRIWIMGGQTLPQFAEPDIAEAFYNDVWNSADGVKWTHVAEKSPWSVPSMIGGQTVFKDRIWILGGGTYDTPKVPTRNHYNDVWSTADGVNWECHTQAAPWIPRQYHDVAVFDGRMWVLEGGRMDTGNRKDVWHSADGVNWFEVKDTPWKPRHAASVFVFKDALWMVVGNNMESDVWKLTRVGK